MDSGAATDSKISEPIHTNSGYRAKEDNKSVRGKLKSMHLYARAADTRMKSKTLRELLS
jgi:uncharacterized protein YcbK (DUF882 family)